MAASIPLARDAATGPLAVAIIVVSFVVLTFTRVETWWVMIGAAAVGLGAKLLAKQRLRRRSHTACATCASSRDPSISFTRLRLVFGELMIRLANLAVKLERLLIEPRLDVLRALIAAVRARQARLDIDVDHQRQIRHQPAAGDAIHFVHHFRAQPARRALIHQRRIGEAVAQHDLALPPAPAESH